MQTTSSIYADWLIDGKSTTIKERVRLTITDGLIQKIEVDVNREELHRSQMIDMSGCLIFPPFVDSHLHLALSGSVSDKVTKEQSVEGCEQAQNLISKHLQYLFNHGILAVRDGGDRLGSTQKFADNNPIDQRQPVILKTAGKGLYRQGRYGSLFGREVESSTRLTNIADEIFLQSDCIKLFNSGPNSLVEFGRQTEPQFDPDELNDFISLAREKGKMVMVHANGEQPVKQAIEAGCHSIEHGYFMGDQNLKRMAEKNITWVPTLFAMKALADNSGSRDKGDVAARTLDHQLNQIRKAKEYGVTIALGTDSGSPGVIHGDAVAKELQLLMDGGLTLAEAIRAATWNGAKLLGVDRKFGWLAAGRPANFLVARGTPAMMPRKMANLEAIYLDGKPCDESLYSKMPRIGKNRKFFKEYT